jgi:hypothetical protein
MPSDPKGEGLARPRPPHDQGDPLTALADIADHRLLISSGGRMRSQRVAYRLMRSHGRLLVGPAGGAGDQPLLDGEEVGVDQRRSSRARSATTLTARSARNRSANSSGSVRPMPTRPAPKAKRTSGREERGRVLGQPVRAGQPIDSQPVTAADTVRSWTRLAVRPVTVRTRVSGSTRRQLRWWHRNKVPARDRATLAVSGHGS